jgi:hypothetical protein
MPVELFSVPVGGLQPGKTTFRIQAGTGVPNLSADFIVAPAGGGDPLIGGDYGAAAAQLEVVGSNSVIRASIAYQKVGAQERLTISYPACPAFDYTVQFQSALGLSPWQALSGAPHNSGSVTLTNPPAPRFFRVCATVP